jgi:hypothetical protein
MSAAERALPAGWQDAWRHVEVAIYRAKDGSRKVEHKHSLMFIFVDHMMRFDWSESYKNDPEAIADLIEKMHAADLVKGREFYGPTWATGTEGRFWEFYGLEGGREEFIATWMSRRYRPGVCPLDVAFTDLERLPVKVSGPSSTIYAKVVGIAYHLQNRLGERNIVLPQERIAEKLGVSQRAVSGYISAAMNNGLLRVVSDCNHAARQAKHYRFVGRVKDLGDCVEVTSNRV